MSGTQQGKGRAHPYRALLVLIVLSVAFNWPYLLNGFHYDDFLIVAGFEQNPTTFSHWGGIWTSQSAPCFENFWWTNGPLRFEFWRPVSSLVMEVFVGVFGRAPFPLHLLSLLLHVWVVCGVYLIARKLSGRDSIGLLAGLFYVCCEDHSITVGWISTITDLLGAAFFVIAALAHIRWLERRRTGILIGSLIALILSMGCKESFAVAPVAILLLTILWPSLQRDVANFVAKRPGEAGGRLSNPLGWLPALIVQIAYVVIYAGFDLGPHDSMGYIHPVAQFGTYLTHAVKHLPVLWLGTFSPAPIFLYWFVPGLLNPLALWGVIVFIIWLMALRPFRRETAVIWAMLFYLASLLPQLGADASERALYLPMIPAAMLLAYVAATFGPIARRIRSAIKEKSRFTRAVAAYAVVILLPLGAVISAWRPWIIGPSLSAPERTLLTAKPYVDAHQPDHTILLNAPNFFVTPYPCGILNYHSDTWQDVWLLSAAQGIFTVARTGDSSFVLRTDRAGWLANPIARILRPVGGFATGQQFETSLFTATIVQTVTGDDDILAVRFDLRCSLTDSACLVLYWNGESYQELPWTNLRENEQFTLADTSDLWKAMQ